MKSQNSFVNYLLSLAQDAKNGDHITTFAKDIQRTKNPERLWEYKYPGSPWVGLEKGDYPTPGFEGEYRRHPHADLILEWEKDQRENPDQVWESRAEGGKWCKDPHMVFATHMQYRRKPNARRIGDHEYPEPLKTVIERGTTYYYPNPTHPALAIKSTWIGCEIDLFRLIIGMIHLTKEAATSHAKAIIRGSSDS